MSNANGYRIGIGGIAIESSTFSPLPSTTADFHILRGDEIIANYPWFENGTFEGRQDVTWLGTLKARSIPGGPVERASYDEMKSELLDRLRASLPLDGFFYDIHGAMTVIGLDDAEGDLITAIREIVGPGCIISTAMDLHGNVTETLVSHIDFFTAYREAPHIDAPETKARGVRNLLAALDAQLRPFRAWVRIPVALPGERTSTFWEPGKTVYGKLKESDSVHGVLDASLWVGYVWADQPRASATTVVTGTDPQAIATEAEKIARRYWDAREAFRFGVPAGTADWCLDQALQATVHPVVISDSGDNPTAGGAGDMTVMAEACLAREVLTSGEKRVIVASVCNEAAVRVAEEAGVGAEVTVSLGGVNDPVNGHAFRFTGEVVSITPGHRVGGTVVVLRRGGVYILVPQRRMPFHEIKEYTRLGLAPSEFDIVINKIGYLEPELKALAQEAYLALTPGAVNQDIPNLVYHRIQRPIYPLAPGMPEPDLTARVFAPIG